MAALPWLFLKRPQWAKILPDGHGSRYAWLKASKQPYPSAAAAPHSCMLLSDGSFSAIIIAHGQTNCHHPRAAPKGAEDHCCMLMRMHKASSAAQLCQLPLCQWSQLLPNAFEHLRLHGSAHACRRCPGRCPACMAITHALYIMSSRALCLPQTWTRPGTGQRTSALLQRLELQLVASLRSTGDGPSL